MEERLEHLLLQAILKKATDIHIQIQSKQCRIFMRTIQGMIEVKSSFQDMELYTYLKFRSNLDLSISKLPQTGMFSFELPKRTLYLRFAVIETLYSKSGVLRILNLSKISELSELSDQKESVHLLKLLRNENSGLILFCGSTGSGKSTTMFTWLNSFTDKRIFTLEDPIEQYYPKLMQIQIQQKIHLSFQEGVAQLLRHDPDILCIGEIRRQSEAQSAIQCSYTGHLVVATLHADTVEKVIGRLFDLGCRPQQLKDVVSAIVIQDLAIVNGKRRAMYEIYQRNQILSLLG